jgi:hypothetical protein
MEECERWLERQEAKKDLRGHPYCVSDEEEYILWKERRGRLAIGGRKEAEKEEESAWEKRMKEGEEEMDI